MNRIEALTYAAAYHDGVAFGALTDETRERHAAIAAHLRVDLLAITKDGSSICPLCVSAGIADKRRGWLSALETLARRGYHVVLLTRTRPAAADSQARGGAR